MTDVYMASLVVRMHKNDPRVVCVFWEHINTEPVSLIFVKLSLYRKSF